MKAFLRNIFGFILRIYEKGDGTYEYSFTKRIVVTVAGMLMTGIFGTLVYMAVMTTPLSLDFGTVISLIFTILGADFLVVGLLGNERAVAKLAKNDSKNGASNHIGE